MEILKSTLRILLVVGIVLPLAIFLVQSWLIYFPRNYDQYDAYLRRAEALEFTNRGKSQTAFLVQRGDAPPTGVWWVFGGNGSLALDWLDLVESVDRPDLAFVLVDYPGYGLCEGRPNPGSVLRSIDALIPVVAKRLELSEEVLLDRSAAMGHSLGAAVALEMAANFELKSVIAISPFTTMKAMAGRTVGPVLSHLLTHRYDNVRSLRTLEAQSNSHILLFHGTNDEIIPFAMGRQLADDFPGLIQFRAVNGAGHNNIILEIEDQLIPILARGTG